jgi:hypothetical protein
VTLLVRIFGYGTRVNNENIGRVGEVYFLVALFFKFARNGRSLRIIELATQGVKRYFFHNRGTKIVDSGYWMLVSSF